MQTAAGRSFVKSPLPARLTTTDPGGPGMDRLPPPGPAVPLPAIDSRPDDELDMDSIQLSPDAHTAAITDAPPWQDAGYLPLPAVGMPGPHPGDVLDGGVAAPPSIEDTQFGVPAVAALPPPPPPPPPPLVAASPYTGMVCMHLDNVALWSSGVAMLAPLLPEGLRSLSLANVQLGHRPTGREPSSGMSAMLAAAGTTGR
eukprot:COSAG05_NODE_3641_length_1938_cov_227.523654_3_plen_200_part_00